MNRELWDAPSDGLADQLPKRELNRGNKSGVYHLGGGLKRSSPYAGVSDDLCEYVIGPVNPLVGKLSYDMEEMRKEMEVMDMIIRGFSTLRKSNL